MNFFVILLIALSLAMDAFAVSVSDGITIKDLKPQHSVKIGLYFYCLSICNAADWLGFGYRLQ